MYPIGQREANGRRKWLTQVAIVLLPIFLVLIAGWQVRRAWRLPDVPPSFTRLGGKSRVETAVEVSALWPGNFDPGRTSPVVVVSATHTPTSNEQLEAAIHATKLNAPLLFIPPGKALPTAVADVLRSGRHTCFEPSGSIENNAKALNKLRKYDLQQCPRRLEQEQAPSITLVAVGATPLGTNPGSTDALRYLRNHNVKVVTAPPRGGLPFVSKPKYLVFATAQRGPDLPDVAAAITLAAHLQRLQTSKQTDDTMVVVLPRYLQSNTDLGRYLHYRGIRVKEAFVVGGPAAVSNGLRELLQKTTLRSDSKTWGEAIQNFFEKLLAALNDAAVPALVLTALASATVVAASLGLSFLFPGRPWANASSRVRGWRRRKGISVPPTEPGIQQKALRISGPFNLPLPNPQVWGREESLEDIRAFLQGPGRTCVLCGLAGVGKTQLALRYAHRYANDYSSIWWLDDGGLESIRQGLTLLARELELPDADEAAAIAHLWDELRRRDRWLLIFDGIQEAWHLVPYLPPGPGHVLVTSRDCAWASLPRSLMVKHIEGLSRDSAASLIGSRTGRSPSPTAPAEGIQEVHGLAEDLGRLPLALEQAAIYIQQTGIPFARYGELLKSRRYELLERGSPLDHPEPLATAWITSLKAAQNIAPLAPYLLDHYSSESPPTIFTLQPTWREGELPPRLREDGNDPLAVADAAGALARYAFITIKGQEVSIPALVRGMAPLLRARLDKQ